MVGRKRPRYNDQMDEKHTKFQKQTINSRLTDLERKADRNYHKNTDLVTIVMGTATTCHYMSGVARGDAVDERSGQSINVTSFAARYVVQLGAADSLLTSQRVVRVIIFQWMDGTGELPVVAEFFERQPYFLSPLNTAHGKEYKVLSNKLIALDNYNRNHVVELFWTSKRMVNDGKINMIDDTALVASSGKNSLFMFALTNDNTNAPSIQIMSKLSYLD